MMTDRLSPEILAPCGGMDSLEAAVRCGADAVYLGGSNFSARASAKNFDDDALAEAVQYCHARNVKVYLAVNTMLFDDELAEAVRVIETACALGIDALITQDLAIAKLAREIAPDLPLHASTQMSIHNLEGAKALASLGFTRVVLARELSRDEIAHITANAGIETEIFVHGALCMCVSGQCYLSSMLGGRSGNRGRCAQPCRLAFAHGDNTHSLSLSDMSHIQHAPALAEIGVASLKIEGRMKRPEYVAAAVTACRESLVDGMPDYTLLEAAFSRGGLTDGYYSDELGPDMFGTRGREDVSATNAALSKLAVLYKDERGRIGVDFKLNAKAGQPVTLHARDTDGNQAETTGAAAQIAITAPTTPEKAEAALCKTGGTYFTVGNIDIDIDSGLMIPVSQLNAMRRDVLATLDSMRTQLKPHRCTPNPELLAIQPHKAAEKPLLRVRVSSLDQLTPALVQMADSIVVPAWLLKDADSVLLGDILDKLIAELPRMSFDIKYNLLELIQTVTNLGIKSVMAGNLYGFYLAKQAGLTVCGDFSLGAANSLALDELARLGARDVTLSIEMSAAKIAALGGDIPRGILVYGYLPLMITRNSPGGLGAGKLTDRQENIITVEKNHEAYELYNPIPLYLADRLREIGGVDFFTLYFTAETAEQCVELLQDFIDRRPTEEKITRGLIYKKLF